MSLSGAIPLLYERSASGISFGKAEYVGEASLKVRGIKVATIKDAHQIQMHDSYVSDVVAAIRQCVPPSVIRNGGQLFEKYCRTICGDRFQDRYDPPLHLFPSLYKSMDLLRMFLGPQKVVEEVINELRESRPRAATNFFAAVKPTVEHRSFISTKAGHIGLAPLLAKSGDDVVVIPGCPSPMVLHPTEDGRYQVVGECFILGFMDGEALLGSLPEGYESTTKLNEEDRCWYKAYRDWRNGKVRWADPRFDLFRSEMQENGTRNIFISESEMDTESVNDNCGVRMMTSALPSEGEEVIVMGVDLQPFELI